MFKKVIFLVLLSIFLMITYQVFAYEYNVDYEENYSEWDEYFFGRPNEWGMFEAELPTYYNREEYIFPAVEFTPIYPGLFEENTPFIYIPPVIGETTGEFLSRIFNTQLTYISVSALERNIFALQEQIATYIFASSMNEFEIEAFRARQQLTQARVINQITTTSYLAVYVESYHTALMFTNLNNIIDTRNEMLRVLTQHGLTYANYQSQVVSLMGPRLINIEHMDLNDLTEHLAFANAQILTVGQNQDFGNVPTSWPTAGHVASRFGIRNDPFTGQLAFHAGVDIGAPIGTPVYAWFNGTVIASPQSTGFGRQVVVRQGEIHVRYAHLYTIDVEVGQIIRQGQQIGTVGSTGRSTGPHLHLGFYIRGVAMNPEYMFRR